MAYNVLISESADHDLGEIVDYIAGKLANLPAASRFLDRVEECYKRLERNPMLYAVTTHPMFGALGIRKAPVGGYCVYYTVEGNEVRVVRILSELESTEGKL